MTTSNKCGKREFAPLSEKLKPIDHGICCQEDIFILGKAARQFVLPLPFSFRGYDSFVIEEKKRCASDE